VNVVAVAHAYRAQPSVPSEKQDQRGSGLSTGDTYKYWRMCGQDGYDTMEWISQQPVRPLAAINFRRVLADLHRPPAAARFLISH